MLLGIKMANMLRCKDQVSWLTTLFKFLTEKSPCQTALKWYASFRVFVFSCFVFSSLRLLLYGLSGFSFSRSGVSSFRLFVYCVFVFSPFRVFVFSFFEFQKGEMSPMDNHSNAHADGNSRLPHVNIYIRTIRRLSMLFMHGHLIL